MNRVSNRPNRRCVVWVLLVATALMGAGPVFAQSVERRVSRLSFQNQPITDVLLVLADVAGVSIVPDTTVRGNATYLFAEGTIGDALSGFASAYDLFVTERDGVFFVSRISAEYDAATDTLTLLGTAVQPSDLIRAASRAVGRTILFDPFPTDQITIAAENLPLERVLQILVARYPDYSVDDQDEFYYLRRKVVQANARAPGRRVGLVQEAGGYSLTLEAGRFSDVIRELFRLEGREYVFVNQSDSSLQQIDFSDKTFDELLQLLSRAAAIDYVIEDGLYYFVTVQQRDVLKQLSPTVTIPLRYIAVGSVPPLLPQDLADSTLYRLDEERNEILLTGTQAEIDPLRDFVRGLDVPVTNRRLHRFEIHHNEVSEVIGLLPERLQLFKPQALGDGSGFVLYGSRQIADEVQAFVAAVDRPKLGVPLRLRFIQADDLLQALPPSVDENDLRTTPDPTLVFFDGSAERLAVFEQELASLDQPVPQIRYQLLVIQNRESDSESININFDNRVLSDPGQGIFDSVYLGQIGRLLNLNFDVISTVGYAFGLELNAALNSTRSRVLADTTLNSLSGREVRFQNTDTFRYIDREINPDTGKLQVGGVTREITSGLIISINGWTSGDGVVSMQVSATISNRTGNTASSTGNPPGTSERVVNAEVRAQSGTPVVISGLLQQSAEERTERVPFFGRLPILRHLLRNTVETVQESELVIYLVPYVERSVHDANRPIDAMDEVWRRLAPTLGLMP